MVETDGRHGERRRSERDAAKGQHQRRLREPQLPVGAVNASLLPLLPLLVLLLPLLLVLAVVLLAACSHYHTPVTVVLVVVIIILVDPGEAIKGDSATMRRSLQSSTIAICGRSSGIVIVT